MDYRIVVIGTSLGGLRALGVLLGGLPPDFALPIAIVQHRHNASDDALDAFLQGYCAAPVVEVEDKVAIRPGHIYLAPRDYHLLVEAHSFALSTESPVWYARPSIDVLFESAADSYGRYTIGVILTGASQDGARGLAAIKARGGLAVVQEPDTAECRVMPEAAIAATAVDNILPLPEIAPFLARIGQGSVRVYRE
jgi:two-component system, chemotaxis family, protein-glutamate methylesterase/glutaminase